MGTAGLDYTCIGGPLHGKRWYAEASYFQVPVVKPLPLGVTIHPTPVPIDEVAFEVFRYRLERFGRYRMWVPNNVVDPDKFVLELALKDLC